MILNKNRVSINAQVINLRGSLRRYQNESERAHDRFD
jgi:hypothetical protein